MVKVLIKKLDPAVEIPTYKTLMGSSLVIISSIIIFRREIYLKKQVSLSRHE